MSGWAAIGEGGSCSACGGDFRRHGPRAQDSGAEYDGKGDDVGLRQAAPAVLSGQHLRYSMVIRWKAILCSATSVNYGLFWPPLFKPGWLPAHEAGLVVVQRSALFIGPYLSRITHPLWRGESGAAAGVEH